MRRAERNDIPSLEKTYTDASIFLDEERIPSPDGGFPDAECLNEYVDDGTLIATTDKDGKICGAARLEASGGALEISCIAFRHGYRGKGCSAALFGYAVRIAQSTGLEALRVTADRRNHVMCMAAIRFGFKINKYGPESTRVFEYMLNRTENGDKNEQI